MKKFVKSKQDDNTNFTPVAKKKVYTDEEKKAFIEKTKKFKVDKKKLGGGKKFKKTDNPLESKTKKLEKVYFI